jgi:hypothetical protein
MVGAFCLFEIGTFSFLHPEKKDLRNSGDSTVDGRNPAPVDRWFIPLFIGFQPSKVVQDFFHQQ